MGFGSPAIASSSSAHRKECINRMKNKIRDIFPELLNRIQLNSQPCKQHLNAPNKKGTPYKVLLERDGQNMAVTVLCVPGWCLGTKCTRVVDTIASSSSAVGCELSIGYPSDHKLLNIFDEPRSEAGLTSRTRGERR